MVRILRASVSRMLEVTLQNGRLVGLLWAALLVVTSTAADGASPEAGEGSLRIATTPLAPFVLKDGERLSGFSVDLWNELARRMGTVSSWNVVENRADLLGVVARGESDVAIAGIVITPERERLIDFSHPYFNSGLQILVRAQNDSSIAETLKAVPWSAILTLVGAAIAIFFLLANVLWLIERRSNPDFQGGYLKALGEGLWGTMLIIATGEHGERSAPGVLKRVVVGAMWLLGVVLVAQLTATVTSAQTVRSLTSGIQGPADLPGKTIGTVPGSAAADYLTRRGLPFVPMHDAEDAFGKLMQGDVRAVVFGAPTLQYWAAKRGQGVFQVVGPLFEPERIGIAVAIGSPLRRRINMALDELYADGTYGEIYERWFKSAH